VSFQDGMIIVTLGASGSTASNVGTAFPTVKVIECIYSVKVDYASSALVFTTGPPGLEATPAAQRCWRGTTSTSGSTTRVTLQRNEPGKACPSAASATARTDDAAGSLDSFTIVSDKDDGSSGLPAGLQPACQIGASNPPLAGVAISANNFWVQPTFLAYTRTGADAAVAALGFNASIWQYCISNPDSSLPVIDSTGTGASFGLVVSNVPGATSAAPGGTGTTVCQYMKVNTASGILSMTPPAAGSAACVTSGSAAKRVFSVSINALPSALTTYIATQATTAPPPPPAAADPATLQAATVPVVSTTLSFGGMPDNYDVSNAASPCAVYALRASLAASTGKPLTSVAITSVTFGANTVQIAATSPGNLQAAACSAAQIGSRRLAAPAAAAGRALANTGTLSAGVQVVAAPGDNSAAVAAIAAAVGQSAAASAATAFQQSQPASSGVTASLTLTAAATAPVTATQTVLIVPTIKRASVYVPNGDITMFHSIPRLAAMGAKPSSNFLDVLACKGSAADYLKCGYLQGVVAPAAGIIAFSILFCVLYQLIYICSCCCRGCAPKCYPKRDPEVYFAGCRKHCGPARALVVFGILNIGLALASLAYFPKFGDAIVGLFGVANDLANVLLNTFDILGSSMPVTFMDGTTGPSLKGGLDSAVTAAQCMSNRTNANTPDAAKQVLSSLVVGLGMGAQMIGPIVTMGKPFATIITALLAGVNIDTIKNYETLAGYVICGFLAANIAVWSALVCKNSCASCLFKVLSPFKIFFMMLVGILAGFYYAIGIIGADVCIAPFAAMQTAVNITGMTGDAPATLNYYLNCAANPALKPAGFLTLLSPTVSQLNFAATQAKSLNESISAVPTPPVFSSLEGSTDPTCTMNSVAVGVSGAATAIAQLQAGPFGCANIDGILNRLFMALCNDGFGTVIAICRILIALAVMLVLQLGVGVDVCCYHPGDPRAWGSPDADEVGKVSPNVASIELALRAPAAAHAHAGAAPHVLGEPHHAGAHAHGHGEGGHQHAESGHTKV